MEHNRFWEAEWEGLPVILQKNILFKQIQKHPLGFSDIAYIHIPYDTLPILLREQPKIVISSELGFRTLQSTIYRILNPKSRLLVWATLSEHTEKARGSLRRSFRKWILRHADGVLVNGESGARYIKGFGYPEARIFKVPYTTDVTLFARSPLDRKLEEAYRLIYVGQLIERKGLILFFEVLINWALNHPEMEIEFWVVGDGPLRGKLLQIKCPQNLKISFLGSISYSELPDIYAKCGILVFPTLADEWGVVVNEALASGLPVLGSVNSQAVEELIKDGTNGWVFYPNNPQSIYEALDRALSTPPERLLKMREISRRCAFTVTPKVVADRIIEAINNISRKRVALMLNIIAPYRLPLIKELAKHFHVRVMVSKTEDNRAQLWDTYVVQELQKLSIEWEKVWGITIILPRFRRGERFDQRYIHINPGYFLSLFRFHPDVIITLEMGFRSIVALLYGFLFHKPVWVWWGGTLHTESSIGFIKRNWRKIFVKIVSRWISYGQLSTEYLLSLGVPREKILQIQNCIDESLFRVKYVKSLQIEPRPVLLYVGQLVKRKGIDLLLQAASKVQQKGLKFSLMLVGSGPEEETLKEMAQELGLSNIYFFRGKSYSEIPSIYKNADVLVLPTLEDVWGIVVNEALWSGLPVLVSRYAGCATEIVPETNIFDPLSPEEFESALERAIRGEIAPPDLSRLFTCNEVASLIIEDIKKTINEDITHPQPLPPARR